MVQKMSLNHRHLRPQLAIAFCLMSVIPILGLLNFIFPSALHKGNLILVISIAVVLSLLGLLVLKRIVDSIIKLNAEAKIIACGEFSREVNINREDEIGELSQALNQLTHHIKDNMDELKIYGERTKDINFKINKQVVALSGVLQIGNLIAQKTNLKDVFNIAVSRVAQIADSSCAFVVLKQDSGYEIVAYSGLKNDTIVSAKSVANEYVFNVFLLSKSVVFLDRKDTDQAKISFLKLFGVIAALIEPIVVQGRAKGFLAIANSSDTRRYTQDDAELLDIFVKQLSIAIENDYLTKKVENLEIKDSLTDLYNRRFISDRLDEEILRAISHQRPCSFVALRMKNLQSVLDKSGELAVQELIRKAADVLKANLGDLDRAGRINFDEFGVILPEKNKKQAQEVADVVKKKVNSDLKQDVYVGVVENPLDGADSVTLIEKAEKAVKSGA